MISKNSSLQTVVYTPESPLRNPIRLISAMLQDLWRARALARRLILRDISAHYRQTALGFLWAILPPLVTAALWIFLNYSQILVVENTGVSYSAYALTGTVFWQLFVDALNAPLTQANANRLLLAKVNFPKEALLLSGIAQVLFSFSIKLVILILLLTVLQIPLRWTAVLLIVPASGLILLGTVIGMLLVPVGFLYRDIQHGVGVIIAPLMYLTPVVYPVPVVGILAVVMRYNPLTPFFQMIRDLLFTGIPGTWQPPVIGLAITIVLTLLVWVVYRLTLPIVTERLDA
jgi:lipopolysaccharide transport system permease protein